MERRTWLKVAAVAAPTILTSSKTAESESVIGHGEFRYRLNKKWSQADHEKVPLKNCHEMVQVADGRLFLLTDEAKNNILVYEKSGRLLETWTLQLRGAHGLTYHQQNGRESLWITDTRGRVIETDLAGKILRELPHGGKAGGYRSDQSYVPTETAIGPDGSIYVIDGYGSQYVLQFASDGSFVKRFGGKSTQPVNLGKFMQAHGIALDTRGKEPSLVCTARIRNEFCWFDLEGNHVKTVYLPGAYMSRPVIRGRELYSGVCFGFRPNDFRMWQGRGFILVMDDQDRVVSCPGAGAPRYEGEALAPLMKEEEAFHNVHDVCVDEVGDLYACQWNAKRVPPYKLERI